MTCLNENLDEALRCRGVGCCVRNMDHFCSWVCGIILQTSFKLLVQFISWTTLAVHIRASQCVVCVVTRTKTCNLTNVRNLGLLEHADVIDLVIIF